MTIANGWYSARCAEICGWAVYLAPDGTRLQVTEVGVGDRPHGKWDDAELAGLVELGSCVATYHDDIYQEAPDVAPLPRLEEPVDERGALVGRVRGQD